VVIDGGFPPGREGWTITDEGKRVLPKLPPNFRPQMEGKNLFWVKLKARSIHSPVWDARDASTEKNHPRLWALGAEKTA